jgi:hypothetical protein
VKYFVKVTLFLFIFTRINLLKNKRMKSIQLLFSGIFLFGTIITNAQISTGAGGAANVLPNFPSTNTNVGIGTNNPAAKLEVVGDVKASKLELTNSLPDGSIFIDWKDKNKKCIVLNVGTLRDPLDNGRNFVVYDFPKSNLDSKPAVGLSLDDRKNFSRFSFFGEEGGCTNLNVYNKRQEDVMKLFEDRNDNVWLQFGKPNSRLIIGGYSDNPNSLGHKLFVENGSAKIEGNILTNSNLGIGTSNFVDGVDTYRLSVKGKIRDEEIKVYTTWADYVFNKEYKLPSLKEVETYIATNGHLPNMPSAKEITEKGLELGGMAKIQQEKIEELTLYLIQQNKEIEELKIQVKALLEKKQ